MEVRAAGLHPIVKALASGTHYGGTGELPLIPGIDGVRILKEGTRVYFSGARPPYGTMAERAAIVRQMYLPLPDHLDDGVAAAIVNPGMVPWLALTWRARLEPGETALVLGATGASGQLAVQMTKGLGAGRIIAAGRNEQILETLPDLGADATVPLDAPKEEVSTAIAGEAGDEGIRVVVDYLWGAPTEAVLAATTWKGLTYTVPRLRLVEVGESAGPTIRLPAAVLRSSGLEELLGIPWCCSWCPKLLSEDLLSSVFGRPRCQVNSGPALLARRAPKRLLVCRFAFRTSRFVNVS